MDKLQTLHPMDGREAIQFAFQYCLPCANQAMGEVLKTLDEMGARSRVIKKDKVVMALKTLLIEDYDVDKCLYFLQDLSLLRLDWNKEEIIIINPALHLCVPNENQKTS